MSSGQQTKTGAKSTGALSRSSSSRNRPGSTSQRSPRPAASRGAGRGGRRKGAEAARLERLEAAAEQSAELLQLRERRAAKTRQALRSEAEAVILEKRPNFLATRESPGWRRRPESRAAKIVEEGADWPLRRRAPTTGFWEKAKGSKKEDQTRKKEAERDDLLANGEAIEAPVQDGAKLAAQGYWISPAFVLERRIRHVKGKRIYEEVKDRFCVNMKRANTRGRKRRFKNDHLEQMPEVMPSVATEPDTHLFSWDVKGAFKLVGLKLKYIHRFCVDLGPDVDGPRFIVMLVLPFGWLNSPWYWGQVMAEPVRSMRRAGIPTLLYVDDGLNSGRTKEEALENRDVVEAILGDYGIIMARGPDGVPTKGQWEPTQVLDCHTGFLLVKVEFI